MPSTTLHLWETPEGLPIPVPIESEVLEFEPVLGVAAAPIPASEIEPRSRGWQYVNFGAPGWRRLFTPLPAIITGDTPLEILRAAGVYVAVFEEMLRNAIDGNTSNREFMIRIYSNQADFSRYAGTLGAANAASLYNPPDGQISTWFNPEVVDEAWFQRILAHEFTHQFMDYVWRRTSPLWFAEGMAEYFSNFDWIEGVAVPGMLNASALGILRGAGTVPLSDFLGMSRADMYGPDWERLYAQSWAFVHFLFERTPQTIRKFLKEDRITLPGKFKEEWQQHLLNLLATPV